MQLDKMIVLRPFSFFIILASVVLVLPSLLIPFWIIKGKKIENEVKIISDNFHQEILSGIENAARMLLPMNSSANNLARVVSASLNKTDLPFFDIETKVAPLLFQALSTIPHLSQISYIGMDGLFFSFYYKGNQQLFAVYTNNSFSTSMKATTNYTWYIQPVNRDTGKLYGETVMLPPIILVNESWIQLALNTINGYASIGYAWNNVDDLLILNMAGINGRGVISLGFQLKSIIDIFSGINLYGGSLYLATLDGKALIQGIPNTSIVLVGNCSLSFLLVKPNGDQIELVGNITQASIVDVLGTTYVLYSSPLEIIGVQLVYVLALPYNGLGTLIHKNISFSFVILILMVGAVVISIFNFVGLTVRAARREMCLRSALIKQKEATQTAERKSMNKSLAFAKANHDIRNYLSGITGHIDMSRDKVDPKSKLGTILNLMQTCTQDILGILNSILDASKIEAGKMQLEEKQFDLGQLLEEVVNMFYPVGLTKGVDVILDLHDGSVSKFSHVKGDNGRLKQILSNLLSNAIKFTSEGYVSVRAHATKPSSDNYAILDSTRSQSIRWLSCLFLKNHEAYSDLEADIKAVQQDPNCMEFVFEVNDTGKGIPKEMQKSVFENYVQVKEANPQYQGTGLGLGIVQSLVRLMGGEITIVDKEVGEKGTCFRFNAFLTVCDSDEIESYGAGGYISSDSHKHSGPTKVINTPKRQESSRVVLFIHSEERRKMTQRSMEALGIKVSLVKHWEQLSPTLKNIMRKKQTSSPHSSSRTSDVSSRSRRSKEVPLSALDGTNYDQRHMLNFILIIIDTNEGHFRELSRAVAEFRRESVDVYSRVVWLCTGQTIHLQGLDENKLPPSDRIITQQLHGSHLYEVISLLPEFEGTFPYRPPQAGNHTPGISYSSPEQNQPVTKQGEIQEIGEASSSREGLVMGKRILLVEDHVLQQTVAKHLLSKLGATVETCQNGKEALILMSKGLSDRRKPYDYILMDCQMPVMDGREATRHIREEEKRYGVRTPIIALTGHADGEELDTMYMAGIDYHLLKPINREMLIDAITKIHSR